MTTDAAPSVRAALDELIHQFADPYAFVRELVQNAIDAGSAEIEIAVTFAPGADGRGITTVTVDDWGCGMTRAIIETKLTRLFSSSKDGDRTMIGKFGVGFVSVFAIEPDVVCIDTSRDGESWRVMFGRDRAFELVALAEPVDGTKVRLLKATTAEESQAIAAACERSARYWCRHVRAEIRFAGRSIAQPFALFDAPIAIDADDGYSHVVVGHPRGQISFAGYYNRGLTLLEQESSPLPGLAFKASSPHLLHTISRDAVIVDDGYQRVLAQIGRVAHGPLAERVFEALVTELASPVASVQRDYLVDAALWHLRSGATLPAAVERSVIARSPGGAAIAVRDVRIAPFAAIHFSVGRSPLTDELERSGYLVIEAERDGAVGRLVSALLPAGARCVDTHAELCRPIVTADEVSPRAWPVLRDAVVAALEVTGRAPGEVILGDLAYPGSTIADRVAIVQRRAGQLDAIADVADFVGGLLARRRVLVVNRSHPLVGELLLVAEHAPAFAAHLLVKGFHLGHRRLGVELDAALLAHAMEHT